MSSSESQKSADDLLLEAMDFFRQGDLATTRAKLQEVLEVDPNHLQAQNYLSVVEARLEPEISPAARRRMETTVVERKAATRPAPRQAPKPEPEPEPEEPEDPRSYFAKNWKRLVIMLGAVVILALAAFYMSDYVQGSMADYKIQQARERIASGQRTDALRVLEWAAEERPEDLESLELLGDTYLQMERSKDALKIFRRIVDSGEATSGIYAKLGHAAAGARDVKTAVWAFQKAQTEGTASIEDLKVLAGAYESLGMLDEAVDTFRRRLSRAPDDLQGRLDLARIYRKSGKLTRAQAEYEKVIRKDQYNNAAYIGLGETLELSDQTEKAIQTYMKPLGWEPNNREILGRLGWLFLAQGQADLAEKQFQKLLVLDSRDATGRAGMAAVYLHQGDLEQAERYTRKALSRPGGQTPEHYLLLARIMFRTNRSDEALAACDRALSMNKASADAWEIKGEILFSTRQMREARLALGRALELDPNRKKAKELLRRTSRL